MSTLDCITGPPVRAFADPVLVERFWGKTTPEPNSGCLLWLRAVDKHGYGKFQIPQYDEDGHHVRQWHVRAHRFALAIRLGRWPVGGVRHCCDVPACVNPDHLTEGTQKDNIQDCIARGRRRKGLPQECYARGERHGMAKLTFAQVQELRRRFENGARVEELARDYEIARTTTSRIAHRHCRQTS